MQLVGANIVLRLIDGGRGDDDLTMNGVVSDLGGPAFAVPAPQLPGDYNLDHTVNAADYVLWRKNSGSGVAVVYGGADGNGDGKVGAEDYTVWRSHFGQTSGSGAGIGLGEEIAEANSVDGTSFVAASDTTFNQRVAVPLSNREPQKAQLTPPLLPEPRVDHSLKATVPRRAHAIAESFAANDSAMDLLLLTEPSRGLKENAAIDDFAPLAADNINSACANEVLDSAFADLCRLSVATRWSRLK